MCVKELEKRIYKSYLTCLSNNGYKHLFDNALNINSEDKDKLKKLSAFFKNHSHINIDMFINAPFKVYSNKKDYNLDFFIDPIALKTYFLYLNLLDDQSADSKDNLFFIKKSLLFIQNFCIEKKITLKTYLNYSDSVTYNWCLHLLNNEISIYNILGFSYFGINIYMLINQLPMDEKELFLNQYNDNISNYMTKLNDSKKAKLLLLRGYKKIKKNIDSELKLV